MNIKYRKGETASLYHANKLVQSSQRLINASNSWIFVIVQVWWFSLTHSRRIASFASCFRSIVIIRRFTWRQNLRRRSNFDNWYLSARITMNDATVKEKTLTKKNERDAKRKKKKWKDLGFPKQHARPRANRSLLSYRTPILIRTRSMQVGWMPASSPGGTAERALRCM